jgi:hypothetical protein
MPEISKTGFHGLKRHTIGCVQLACLRICGDGMIVLRMCMPLHMFYKLV